MRTVKCINEGWYPARFFVLQSKAGRKEYNEVHL